jgi:hypothetical protein
VVCSNCLSKNLKTKNHVGLTVSALIQKVQNYAQSQTVRTTKQNPKLDSKELSSTTVTVHNAQLFNSSDTFFSANMKINLGFDPKISTSLTNLHMRMNISDHTILKFKIEELNVTSGSQFISMDVKAQSTWDETPPLVLYNVLSNLSLQNPYQWGPEWYLSIDNVILESSSPQLDKKWFDELMDVISLSFPLKTAYFDLVLPLLKPLSGSSNRDSNYTSLTSIIDSGQSNSEGGTALDASNSSKVSGDKPFVFRLPDGIVGGGDFLSGMGGIMGGGSGSSGSGSAFSSAFSKAKVDLDYIKILRFTDNEMAPSKRQVGIYATGLPEYMTVNHPQIGRISDTLRSFSSNPVSKGPSDLTNSLSTLTIAAKEDTTNLNSFLTWNLLQSIGGIDIDTSISVHGFNVALPDFAKDITAQLQAPSVWSLSISRSFGTRGSKANGASNDKDWFPMAQIQLPDNIKLTTSSLVFKEPLIKLRFPKFDEPSQLPAKFPLGVAFVHGLADCITKGDPSAVPIVRLSSSATFILGKMPIPNIPLSLSLDIGSFLIDNGLYCLFPLSFYCFLMLINLGYTLVKMKSGGPSTLLDTLKKGTAISNIKLLDSSSEFFSADITVNLAHPAPVDFSLTQVKIRLSLSSVTIAYIAVDHLKISLGSKTLGATGRFLAPWSEGAEPDFAFWRSLAAVFINGVNNGDMKVKLDMLTAVDGNGKSHDWLNEILEVFQFEVSVGDVVSSLFQKVMDTIKEKLKGTFGSLVKF